MPMCVLGLWPVPLVSLRWYLELSSLSSHLNSLWKKILVKVMVSFLVFFSLLVFNSILYIYHFLFADFHSERVQKKG